MTDWATVSSLATAAGTFVLAIATFGAVRSGNRSARLAEVSLLASVRPLLMPSRPDDAPLKVGFADDHWVRVAGSSGTIEITDENVYMTMSLRNAGTGIAVLHGWRIEHGDSGPDAVRPDLDSFRRLTRDLYFPAGDVYFWQGAIRDTADPERAYVTERVASRQRILIDILYGDQHGGQRLISRFLMAAREDGTFLVAVARQWNVDRPDPR